MTGTPLKQIFHHYMVAIFNGVGSNGDFLCILLIVMCKIHCILIRIIVYPEKLRTCDEL